MSEQQPPVPQSPSVDESRPKPGKGGRFTLRSLPEEPAPHPLQGNRYHQEEPQSPIREKLFEGLKTEMEGDTEEVGAWELPGLKELVKEYENK